MSQRKRLGLIHGFTGSPASWDRVLQALKAHIATDAYPIVCRPAVLGHGAPDASPSPSISQPRSFVAEADRLLDAICGEATHVDLLCGYSLGGRLALTAALRRPDRVARLVLIGAHFGLEDPADREQRRHADQRWIELLEAQGIEAFVDAWEALPLFAHQRQQPPSVQRAHRARRLSHLPKGLAAALRHLGLAEMPPTQPHLHHLSLPTTLVVGEQDKKFKDINQEIAPRLPGTTRTGTAPRLPGTTPTGAAPRLRAGVAIEVVADCGHDVVLGRPEALAAILARVLGES